MPRSTDALNSFSSSTPCAAERGLSIFILNRRGAGGFFFGRACCDGCGPLK